jgi:glucose/mannose transport system substrate-binding protein
MNSKRSAARGMLGFCAAITMVACGSEGDPAGNAPGTGGSGGSDGTSEDVVEIFSWWIAPGEAEALQALVDVHKEQHENSRIFNAAEESGAEARARLAERLDQSEPPDLFQENAHELPNFIREHSGLLRPLDSFLDRMGYDQMILSEVLDNVSVDGSVYAMPVNLHRENTLYYNKQIFADYGLTPPTTLAEFFDICETLEAAGVAPVATANQGWILRIMFNTIAMGSMGPEAYQAYFSGQETGESTALQQAITEYSSVLEQYVNADWNSAEFGWTQAAQAVFEGEAAMFLHGDWATGYFEQLGWTAGVDFGAVSAPGANDLFLYGVDAFAMPEGGPNPEGAEAFLETVGSEEGQISFNRIKGSSPMRLDVDATQFDAIGQETIESLRDASIRMLTPAWTDWDNAFAAYGTSGDADALYQFFVDTYPGR